ncbi:MAG TPA: CHAT domain-containing protein [Ktedonobacteraceae bacterium]|nr:CHAT domain-containing protein [Ktedonobacteraceae bacterium]
MDTTLFLQHLREASLEEGRAYLNAHLAELSDATTIGDLLADEALKYLYNPFLSLKLSELLIYYGEITGSVYAHALGLKAKGDALLQIRHHEAVLECLNLAGEMFLSLNDERNWARSRISWIGAAASLGKVEAALEHASQAREIFSRLQEPYWVCVIDHNTAWIYKQIGRYADANQLYERMLTIYPTLTEQSETFILRAIAMAKVSQAVGLFWMGEFERSYQLELEAQEIFKTLHELDMVVNCEINLADLDYAQGYYGSALQRYYQAQDLIAQYSLDNPKLVAEIKYQIANVLVKLNRVHEASQLAHEAVEMSRNLGSSLHTSNILREYGTILIAAGRLKEALTVFDEARDLFDRGGLQHHAAITQLQRAELLLEMGDHAAAYNEASSVNPYFEQQGLVARSVRANLVMAGSLIEQSQDAKMHGEQGQQLLDEAILLCKQVALQARKYHLQEEVYKSQSLLGKSYALQNNLQRATKHYAGAIAQIERILDNLVFDLSPSFLHSAWQVYEDMIALCLQQKLVEPAFSYLERARSMALRQNLHTSRRLFEGQAPEQDDALTSSLLENRTTLFRIQSELKTYQDRYRNYSTLLSQLDSSVSPDVERGVIEAELQQCEAKLSELFERLYLQQATAGPMPDTKQSKKSKGNPIDVSQLRQRLVVDQMLLAYFLYKDALIFFVLRKGQLTTLEIPEGAKQLKRLLPLLHAHLQSGGWPDSRQPPQQAVRSMLNKLYRLLIAPVQAQLPATGGQLTIVPYGPLHTVPFHALYDGSRYLIEDFQVDYLPASSMLLAHARDITPSPSKPPLIFGYSDHGHLQRAIEEAGTVAAMLTGRCYLDEEASIARLIEEAPGSPLIHLATHGHSRLDAPNFSSILLADGRFNAIDAFSLDLQGCELVTLSGCETGLALTGGGDEQLGLGRAFLAAGAQSLLMSLWPVEDQATNELMQLFYQHLLEGRNKAQALQGAQCSLLHKGMHYVHPYYWAAFRLVGNTGPLQFPTRNNLSSEQKIQSAKN